MKYVRSRSSCIEQRPSLVNALPEEGILDGRIDDEIYRMSKEQLQSLQQPEVGVGVFSRGQRLEFNQEVQVAFASVVVAGGSRAEQVQSENAVPDAEVLPTPK